MPSMETLYHEAIQIQQQGNLEGAIDKLQILLEQDPKYALAHAALGVFYGKLQQYDEAIEHAGKVCELEPEDPFSFISMSLICQQAGRIPEAERAMMQARQVQATMRQGPQ